MMMRWLLDQARERSEPVAVLWASESAIYQRFGFGIGTLQSEFDIERTRVAFAAAGAAARADPAGRCRRGRPTLPADLRRHPRPDAGRGDPERGQVARRPARGRRVAARRQRHEVPGGPRGRRRGPRLRDLPGQGRMGRAGARTTRSSCSRSSALDAAAERALWEWLFGIDLVGHIKGRTRPDAASLAAPADRAAPAGPERARGHVAAPDRPAAPRSRRGRMRRPGR